MRLQTQCLRRVVGVLTLTTTLFSIPAARSFAQASLFDPTFAVGSLTNGVNGTVYSIVPQDDGKIIVGGNFIWIAGQARSNLVRFNATGELDPTFPGDTSGSVTRLLKQSDGKILVAGSFTNLQGVSRLRIGRLLANGTTDPDFDAGAIFNDSGMAFSLALQPGGKILVGAANSQPSDSPLFRLEENGHLDPTFIQTNLFGQNYPWSMMTRADGSILLGGGFQTVNGIPFPGLALLKPNGELDQTFTSPLKTNSSFFDYSGVYSIVPMPDGGCLIGGRFWKQGSASRLTVARLTPLLTWDEGFQPDGFDPGSEYSTEIGYVMAALRQSDGKFVLGGHFQEVGGYWRRCIVRLDSNGKVDPCFDPGLGLANVLMPGVVQCLALQNDGKVLVGGQFLNLMSNSDGIARLLPQSECNSIRVHLNLKYGIVGGTSTPGGTNHLEWSTNCADWFPAMSATTPYVYSSAPTTLYDKMFFRVRKEY